MQTLRIYIDEAGRGPLAGPVFVGLTMSLCNFKKTTFQDSKVLNVFKRRKAYKLLFNYEQKNKIIVASGRASNKDIDTKGIIASLQKACHQGIFVLLKKYFILHRKNALLQSQYGEDHIAAYQLTQLFTKGRGGKKIVKQILHMPNSIVQFKSLIIDGNHSFGLEHSLGIKVITIIKGDQKNRLISAASIVAKVERDDYMIKVSKQFSVYNFSKHKGYGTKAHREAISQHGLSCLHRQSFCQNIITKKSKVKNLKSKIPKIQSKINNHLGSLKSKVLDLQKPKLLLHICCAPDLTWPLQWLKQYFKLYLFRYNPNIHPRKEHAKRYEQFIKLTGLEKGDYEILEDWYNPQEFFDAMIEHKTDIAPQLKNTHNKEVLMEAKSMKEQSNRCNPCYSMRLSEAAKNATKYDIPYFTSTLLISPRKDTKKLLRRGKDAEKQYTDTKFLQFNFAKNDGFKKSLQLTKKYKLYRQNYCGCGRTIPKK